MTVRELLNDLLLIDEERLDEPLHIYVVGGELDTNRTTIIDIDETLEGVIELNVDGENLN